MKRDVSTVQLELRFCKNVEEKSHSVYIRKTANIKKVCHKKALAHTGCYVCYVPFEVVFGLYIAYYKYIIKQKSSLKMTPITRTKGKVACFHGNNMYFFFQN